jgi:hypothetical protein
MLTPRRVEKFQRRYAKFAKAPATPATATPEAARPKAATASAASFEA